MRPVPLTTTLTFLLALAGCGTPPGQPVTSSSGYRSGTTAAGTSATTSAAVDRCGPRTLTATLSAPPPAPQCLTADAVLRIRMPDAPARPWSWPVSSDDAVVHCTARQLPQGAAEAVCIGRRTGTATVTTSATPFAGDPHGPPQAPWQVTITVT